MGKKKSKAEFSTSFRIGAVCLVFLIIGYELSLFIHKAAVERVESLRDHPDTVYVVDSALAAALLSEHSDDTPLASGSPYALSGVQEKRLTASVPDKNGGVVIKKQSQHSEAVKHIRESSRRVESFAFNPNTVSVEDLQRLGFSEKQAQSIDNYRKKGGRFRRKSDFEKSYVVSDSVYRRLEPFINIPKLDINKADSAAFDALPGIGGYFASKMVSYRAVLGGYSCTEQLMEIYHFDKEKFDALSDLIFCSAPADSFRLWTLPLDSLRRHPYVRNYATARSIVFFREHNPRSRWTIDALFDAGVIDDETAERLSRCAIAAP